MLRMVTPVCTRNFQLRTRKPRSWSNLRFLSLLFIGRPPAYGEPPARWRPWGVTAGFGDTLAMNMTPVPDSALAPFLFQSVWLEIGSDEESSGQPNRECM